MSANLTGFRGKDNLPHRMVVAQLKNPFALSANGMGFQTGPLRIWNDAGNDDQEIRGLLFRRNRK
ncbi:MAG TPA: hypothetical protein VGH81_13265 [Rudaea sp.]|jgi:hypothetical protein